MNRLMQIGQIILFVGCSQILTACIEGKNQEFFVGPNNTLEAPLTPPNSTICVESPNADACDRTSSVTSPGVVTILFTMMQIPQASATLILANAIKYASPSNNPKILFLKDFNTAGEDEGDPTYIKDTLLAGYRVTYKEIGAQGLMPSEIGDADIVMVSNPGYPLSNITTLNTLQRYNGGIILMGDDMSHGANFSVESLTGLHYYNNGTSMNCGGQSYNYDNLQGYFYQIEMDAEFLPGVPAQYMNYSYGNDLDWSTPSSDVLVLAWGSAAPGTCDIGFVPAVTLRQR
jgi:hypothetical protein